VQRIRNAGKEFEKEKRRSTWKKKMAVERDEGRWKV